MPEISEAARRVLRKTFRISQPRSDSEICVYFFSLLFFSYSPKWNQFSPEWDSRETTERPTIRRGGTKTWKRDGFLFVDVAVAVGRNWYVFRDTSFIFLRRFYFSCPCAGTHVDAPRLDARRSLSSGILIDRRGLGFIPSLRNSAWINGRADGGDTLRTHWTTRLVRIDGNRPYDVREKLCRTIFYCIKSGPCTAVDRHFLIKGQDGGTK